MIRRRYSLSLHITTLFVVITAIIGAILIAISYRHSEALLTGSARSLSHENSSTLESVFTQNAAPILTTLDYMALSEVVIKDGPPIEELRFLSFIELIFERNKHLVALYYANQEGDFVMMRPLRSIKDRARFNAPLKAVLLINYTRIDGTNEFYYLDGNNKQIGFTRSDDNQFDPRVRPWYTNADSDGLVRLTEPYFFYFLKTNGVTFSRQSKDTKAVVGADFTLESLSDKISELGFSRKSQLVLFDTQFKVLAQHQANLNLDLEQSDIARAMEDTKFAPVLNRLSKQSIFEIYKATNGNWAITLTPVYLNKNVQLLLAEATPQDDLLKDLLSMRDRQSIVALLLLSVGFVVVLLAAKRLASPIKNLVNLTDNIARFDFKKTRYPKSRITEVANLTESIELMEHTLHDLLHLLRETASNQDFNVLAKTIAHQSYLVTKAETIKLFSFSESDKQFVVAANHAIIPFKININHFLLDTAWLKEDLRKGEVVHLNRHDNALNLYREQFYNSDIYLFPLLNRDSQLVGILLLGYERAITKEQNDKHAFLKELVSFAEIAKENIDQMQQQKAMFSGFVELIANAIDTKSVYRSDHCQRIPKLTALLADAVIKDENYYPQFGMTAGQWEELQLASWLHDCGKITTPEHVLDKATKLETVYDRIHEVRMRFELVKQQAETDFWKAVSEGGDKEKLTKELEVLHTQLDEEFEFIGKCNRGDTELTDDDIERIKTISTRKWKRTLCDKTGLGWMNVSRNYKIESLPVWESLLADKVIHQVAWDKSERTSDLWTQDYILQPGELKYNLGEIYNLSVKKGTLTTEESFLINDHVVQTMAMLNKLPYPDHLRNIPEIAANHHERMDGSGYPRGLEEEKLSIQSRIMAIADTFEALTSDDRPYKRAYTLGEALELMTEMATSGKLDPKLYMLFLKNELYVDYVKEFMPNETLTKVSNHQHVLKMKQYLKYQF
ncbi:HD domain-containing phosphohydrolase [Vibrio sonorensis]|uniref:HD domain-containing phosphohydrolase n=1 Tax=Vibrio sonorensis TaxID=1004316 RepID=UPI0008DA2177|nr:HD domain-containing phosphohydrolase [Vibrio sonorensis]